MTMTANRARELNVFEQIQSAAPGAAEVRHKHVGCLRAEGTQHIVGLSEAPGGHAADIQRFLQHPTNGRVVVHQPNLQRPRVHAESMGSEMTKMVRPGALSNSINPP